MKKAIESRNLKTGSLTFDDIKTDLTNYLRYQEEFSDYDFTGSGLSVLLNLLSYNTHYNGVYDNMALNESFIDSAVKRSSVVSLASMVGYTPRSAQSATAIVNLTVMTDAIDAPDVLSIPSWSAFTTKIGNTKYTFYNTSDISASKEGSIYTFENVELKEGTLINFTQEFHGNYFETFKLENDNIDTNTIRVSVRDNAESSDTEGFTLAANSLNINDNSKAYFLKATKARGDEIQFGTGMLGKPLVDGNIVQVQYLVCHTTEPNGVSNFSFDNPILPNSSNFVTTIQSASGGAIAESTDSIRKLAPKNYTVQNRCVTADDYETTLMRLYPNARSVRAWGGQDETPPQYGKVFLSVIPQDGELLNENEKNYILNLLLPKKSLTTTLEIKDANLLKLQLWSSIYFNSEDTTLSKTDIETLVRNEILNYSDKNLGDFGNMLRFSNLTSMIDNCEPSITNNTTRLKLVTSLSPILNIMSSYLVEVNNPIYQPFAPSESVISSGFYCTDLKNTICYIDDEPTTGKLRLFYKNASNEKVIIRSCGSIDYTSGLLQVDDINITSLAENEFRFVINPSSFDVVTKKNQFVIVDPVLLSVTAIANNEDREYSHVSALN